MYDAVFLDRDGTIIEDPGYLSDPASVRLRPGSAAAIRSLNRVGIPVIVVTNQSGIGRGYYTEEDFMAVQRELERQLAARGARIDDVFHCPHDPTLHACDCRKPGPELFRRAASRHGLRLDHCLDVGDRDRDLEPGRSVGADTILVAGPDGGYDDRVSDQVPRFSSLFEAIRRAVRAGCDVTGRLQLAVFVSGSGTNLQALLDRFPDSAARVAAVSRVVASRPGIGALQRAERAGVPWSVLPAGTDGDGLAAAMLEELETANAGLVVLAGFLKLIPESVVRAYRGRILNIHPALLPAFGGSGMYGRRVHEAVLRSGARISGATVHVVDEEYDRGPIVAQWPVPVLENDDPDTLAARILEVEHRLLPDVVEALAVGNLSIDDAGNPEWHRPLFAAEAFVLAPQKHTR